MSLVPAAILQQVQQCLPPRPRASHKGNFGHVVVIGGDYGMPGSVRMAGESALRMGGGLATVVTRPEHVAAVVANRPELMCYGVKKPQELAKILARATVLIIGPGLGRSLWAKELFACAMHSELPMVVDADALFWVSQFELSRDNWILTPHPGEAARLLQTTSEAIQQNRLGALGMLQQQLGGVVVLKGAGTLVLGGSHQPFQCEYGNPGMASGGMGDVLSGMIAGLIAQQVPLEQAAQLGVTLHALAGDLAAEKQGELGLLATDLLAYLPMLLNPTAHDDFISCE